MNGKQAADIAVRIIRTLPGLSDEYLLKLDAIYTTRTTIHDRRIASAITREIGAFGAMPYLGGHGIQLDDLSNLDVIADNLETLGEILRGVAARSEANETAMRNLANDVAAVRRVFGIEAPTS